MDKGDRVGKMVSELESESDMDMDTDTEMK